MAIAHNRYRYWYKFVTVSLPKRLRNGRLNSETVQKRNCHLDPEVLKKKIRWNF
jgi:hypothetical protein